MLHQYMFKSCQFVNSEGGTPRPTRNRQAKNEKKNVNKNFESHTHSPRRRAWRNFARQSTKKRCWWTRKTKSQKSSFSATEAGVQRPRTVVGGDLRIWPHRDVDRYLLAVSVCVRAFVILFFCVLQCRRRIWRWEFTQRNFFPSCRVVIAMAARK